VSCRRFFFSLGFPFRAERAKLTEVNNFSASRRVVTYSRVSTTRDQNPEVQRAELKRYCESRGWLIVEEILDHGFSGTRADRPGLKRLLQLVRAREVDAVVIVKLDRLFRSLKHLVLTATEFSETGVELVSLKDQLDFTTSAGKLLFHLLACFSEFEAAIIRERTILGLEYAKSKGKVLGRPMHWDYAKILELRSSGLSYSAIQKNLGCSKGAICRAIQSAPETGAPPTQISPLSKGVK